MNLFVGTQFFWNLTRWPAVVSRIWIYLAILNSNQMNLFVENECHSLVYDQFQFSGYYEDEHWTLRLCSRDVNRTLWSKTKRSLRLLVLVRGDTEIETCTKFLQAWDRDWAIEEFKTETKTFSTVETLHTSIQCVTGPHWTWPLYLLIFYRTCKNMSWVFIYRTTVSLTLMSKARPRYPQNA